MSFNRFSSAETLARVISETTDPTLINRLEVVRKHMHAEAIEDVEALVESISPKGVWYRSWGVPDSGMPKDMENPREAVRAFYQGQLDLGSLYFQYDLDRVAVTPDLVLTEGTQRSFVPAPNAIRLGATDVKPDDVFEFVARVCALWPFDETNLLTGEEFYVSMISLTRIDDHSVIPADWFERRAALATKKESP